MSPDEISRRYVAQQTGNPRYDHGLSQGERIPAALYAVALALFVIILAAGAVLR